LAIQNRANHRCEYCRMHQSLQGATFHIEHIVPKSRGGLSTLENLAWCFPSCNLHKADRSDVVDPDSKNLVPIFHPRRDEWKDHFRWNGYQLRGRTPSGRATILALKLNNDRRILIRRAEERFDVFPPA